MGENGGFASGPGPDTEVPWQRLEALAERLRLRSELALIGSIAFAAILAASIPAVTPVVVESILTLLFTAPALVLAVYGVARTQIQRLVQAAEPLDDRFSRRSRHLGWTAGVLITVALFVGLTALGAIGDGTSGELLPRMEMFIVLFGGLFGVYALTDAVILARQSLTPGVLSDRLVRGFDAALTAGRGGRRRACSESLMNLALAAVEEGRAADLDAFVAALGACLELEASPDAAALAPDVEDAVGDDGTVSVRGHLLRLSVRVADRSDQIAPVLRALGSAPVSGPLRRTEIEDTIGLLGRVLRRHPSETRLIASALELAPKGVPAGLWHEPVRLILLGDVPEAVVEDIEAAALAGWNAGAMTDEEFTAILDGVLQEFADAPTRAATRRIIGFCERSEGDRQLPEESVRILAERVIDLATRVSGQELQSLLQLLARHRSISLEALRRLESSSDALARWSLLLRMVQVAGRAGWTPPRILEVPDPAEIPGVFEACAEVLARTGGTAGPEAPSAAEVARLMQALAPVGLGLLPVVANLRIEIDVASRQDRGRSSPGPDGTDPGPTTAYTRKSLRDFGPDFSARSSTDATDVAPLGFDLVADALSEALDLLGSDSADGSVDGAVLDPVLLSILTAVVLEAVRRSGFEPRTSALVGRLLDVTGGVAALLELLVDEGRACVLSHCREIEHLLLPVTVGEVDLTVNEDLLKPSAGTMSEWTPRPFMVSMREGLLALVVAASSRGGAGGATSAGSVGPGDRRDVVARLLRHVMRPGVSIQTVSPHLLDVVGHELREALVGTRGFSGGDLDGRDTLVRLLVPDPAFIGRHLEAGDAHGLSAAAGVMSMYLESGPGPGAGAGLRRTKATLAATVMLLMAMKRIARSSDVNRELLEESAADLQAMVTLWLEQALENSDTLFMLARMIQNAQPVHLWRDLAADHMELNRELAAVLDISGIGIAPQHSAASRSVDLVLRVNPWLEAATLRSGRTVPGLTTAPRAMATFLRRAGDLPPHDQLRRISQDLTAALLRCRAEIGMRAKHGVPNEGWEVNVPGSLDEGFVDLLLLVFEFIVRHSFRLEGRGLAQMQRDLDRIAVRPGRLAERAEAVRSLVSARTSS